MRLNRFEWVLLILVVAAGGGAWTLYSRVPEGDAAPGALPPAPRPGFAAPDFTLADLSGNRVRLSALRGRPVVLNFWATWCPPCLQELPHFKAAAAAAGERAVFVGVDDAEATSVVADFAQRNAVNYLLAIDPSGGVARDYRVDALPATFFIDADGIVRDMVLGPLTPAVLQDKLAALGVAAR